VILKWPHLPTEICDIKMAAFTHGDMWYYNGHIDPWRNVIFYFWKKILCDNKYTDMLTGNCFFLSNCWLSDAISLIYIFLHYANANMTHITCINVRFKQHITTQSSNNGYFAVIIKCDINQVTRSIRTYYWQLWNSNSIILRIR
jgi:hypothetical protein